MKIAIMIDSLGAGGAERQAILSVAELRKLGHVVDLIYYNPLLEYPELLADLEITPICIEASRIAQRCRQFRDLFRRQAYQVVHGFKLPAEVYTAIAGAWAGTPCRFGGSRTLYDFNLGYRILHYFVDKLLDGWIVNSKVAAESMSRRTGISRKKILLVHNGLCLKQPQEILSCQEAKERLGVGPNAFVVTMVARLEPMKNHRMLIEAAGRVLEEVPEAKFLVVGKGSLRSVLYEQASARGISKSMLFLGHRTDIMEILAATDVSVLTTDFEGLPNAIVESMAAGKAIVCTSYPGAEEIMFHEVNALLSPCRNAEAFARNVIRLRTDDRLRHRLGCHAAEYARTHFSPEAMARSLEAIYLRYAGNAHAAQN